MVSGHFHDPNDASCCIFLGYDIPHFVLDKPIHRDILEAAKKLPRSRSVPRHHQGGLFMRGRIVRPHAWRYHNMGMGQNTLQ